MSPPANPRSIWIAARCSEFAAIWSAVVCAVLLRTASRATRSGRDAANSSACIPPIEPPTTAANRSIPRGSASCAWAATWSRTVTNGKRDPHSTPSGDTDEGPVEPWRPPSMFGATTNHRSVSIALPGPTTSPHHPAVRWPGPASPATCESPVSAWNTRTALSWASFSAPQVS